MQSNSKILIIRFSSFGDVTQCLSVPSKIKEIFSESQIHWATRSEFAPLLEGHPHIQKIWTLDKKKGFRELINLALKLRSENFTHIYDAHNNLRSYIISSLCCFFKTVTFIRRPIYRWKRFLLFNFRINQFQMPFSGQRDLIQPLKKWGITETLPPAPQIFIQSNDQTPILSLLKSLPNEFICLAPSAAFVLKRWPMEKWIELLNLNPDLNCVFLGGPEDLFIQEIISQVKNKTFNFAGKLNYKENALIIQKSKLLISNDTGLMHIAEQLGHPCIALMGPAPFGFPSRSTTLIIEKNLKCKPCSKHGQGPCVNKEYHLCMKGISPVEVNQKMHEQIKNSQVKGSR